MVLRRCLGCSATYPLEEHACPECGSHAGEAEDMPPEEDTRKSSSTKRKPTRRKT
jgi:rRNA maturation endonuclease Nob1